MPLLKQWEYTPYDVEEATLLYKSLQIHPVFCQLLVQRGITTYEAAKRFFRPQLHDVHDPFLMKDMGTAVQRIASAIIKQEQIMVYGDYDVDGTTGVALLVRFLQQWHKKISYYIPDRYQEGYGMSIKGVDAAIRQNCSLIIVIDCGIKAHESITFAKQHEVDVIVCDHHEPSATLPDAFAILNPKQADCDYPNEQLSGAAIAYKLTEAFAQWYDIDLETHVYTNLDLVAVSLACDFVALTGENRVLATYGLQRLNEAPCLGLNALTEALHKETAYNIRDVVFGIGPLLNAAGRMLHASKVVDLLLSQTPTEANLLVQTLFDANQERKLIERAMLEEAEAQLEQDVFLAEKKALILFNENWHKGIVGILAARIADLYHKPTIVLTESNGRLMGSARSVAGFNLYEALHACEEHLSNYGGHAFAAGLRLKASNLEAFQQQFEQEVAKRITEEQQQPSQLIDADLDFAWINEKFWRILKQFAPFGPGNMRPVFSSKQVVDLGYAKLIKDKHLKVLLQQNKSTPIEGIGFHLGHYLPLIQSKRPIELCYVIEENHFRDRQSLQLNIRDIRVRT